MRKVLCVICGAILLSLTCGCSKQKCTDLLALNYDSYSKETDGGCVYGSYGYIGEYMASDSIIDTYYYWVTHKRENYAFTVAAYDRDTLMIASFFKCTDILTTTVDSTSILIRDNDFCDRQMHGYFDFIGDTIKYNCWYSNSAGTMRRWGVAVKVK